MITKEDIAALNARFKDASPEEVLAYCLKAFKDRIALSSSLSIEDQALTKMIVDIDKSTRIFTLDTGRLFPETYQLIDRTNLTYNIKIEVFFPDYREVQRMVREEGINLFYNSIESRHRCCAIRKLEPLKRAFQGLDAWICGLRHEQSVTRNNWTEQQVRDYIHQHHVPYNKLFDKGYPSIGCEPCTRAVKPGDDPRSGRWWWEAPDKRECGLHQRY